MAEQCLILSCPEVVRASLMDPCTGEPTPGLLNGYAQSCPRNWSLEPITREGEASEFISDCGFVVARDRQDDQLQGWTVAFETANRSNELQALVTGETLIASGGQNIGTIGTASLTCTAPEDLRFYVEVFYKLSRCTSGANHVRYVIPNVQFKVTELDREGSITFYRYTGESAPSRADGVGDGPFNDLPAAVEASVVALPANTQITHLSFEETISIEGSCGSIEVPAEA